MTDPHLSIDQLTHSGAYRLLMELTLDLFFDPDETPEHLEARMALVDALRRMVWSEDVTEKTDTSPGC